MARTLGEFISEIIAARSGTVMKIATGYYNVPQVAEAARYIDYAMFRELNLLEALMVEVLVDLAGFSDVRAAHTAFISQLTEEDRARLGGMYMPKS